MNTRGVTDRLGLTVPLEPLRRTRYERITMPRDDSTLGELRIGLVVQLAVFGLFVASALFSDQLGWRVIAAAAAGTWLLVIRANLRLLRCLRAQDRR